MYLLLIMHVDEQLILEREKYGNFKLTVHSQWHSVLSLTLLLLYIFSKIMITWINEDLARIWNAVLNLIFKVDSWIEKL